MSRGKFERKKLKNDKKWAFKKKTRTKYGKKMK